MRTLSGYELTLLIDALALAASRHESQARKVRFCKRHHDDVAHKMRQLRVELVKERMITAPLPKETASHEVRTR